MNPRKLAAPFALAVVTGLFASSLTTGVAHAGPGPGPKPAEARGYATVENAANSEHNLRGYVGFNCGYGAEPNSSIRLRPGDIRSGLNSIRTYGTKNRARYPGSRWIPIKKGVCFNLTASGSWYVKSITP